MKWSYLLMIMTFANVCLEWSRPICIQGTPEVVKEEVTYDVLKNVGLYMYNLIMLTDHKPWIYWMLDRCIFTSYSNIIKFWNYILEFIKYSTHLNLSANDIFWIEASLFIVKGFEIHIIYIYPVLEDTLESSVCLILFMLL